MAEKSMHGYDAVFVPPLDKKYSCPVCLAALQDPVQTSCGHRFCEACLKMSFGNKKKGGRCPVDKKWCNLTGDVFPDIAVKREILSLIVKCHNHVNECEWQGELRDFKSHEESCPKAEVECDICSDSMLRCELAKHQTTCPKRLEGCSHCGLPVIFVDMPKHQVLNCTKFPVTCPYCCEPGILREDIPHHVDAAKGDCPLVTVPCKYQHIGCYYQDKRKNMTNHHEAAGEHHLMLLSTVTVQNKETIYQQTRKLREMSEELQNLKSLCDEQKRVLEIKDNEIQRQATRLAGIQCNTGKLLWKFVYPGRENINKVVSPEFYTGTPGYKLKVFIDPKGLTEFGRTYTTLSVKLLPGDFDDVLKFPFEARCQVVALKDNLMPDYKVCFKLSKDTKCNSETVVGTVRKLPSVNELQKKRLISNGKVTLDVQVDVCYN